MNDLQLLLTSAVQTQSLLHTIEQMDQKNPYKQQKKLALNNFLEHVNKLIIELEFQQDIFCNLLKDEVKDENGKVIERVFNLRQSQNFIDCVTEFYNLAKSINVINKNN